MSFFLLRLIPNSIFKAKSERRKLFIGDQLDECKDYSGLFYVVPFQKGFLVNWDVEKQIWDYMFGKEVMKVIRQLSLHLHHDPTIQRSLANAEMSFNNGLTLSLKKAYSSI